MIFELTATAEQVKDFKTMIRQLIWVGFFQQNLTSDRIQQLFLEGLHEVERNEQVKKWRKNTAK